MNVERAAEVTRTGPSIKLMGISHQFDLPGAPAVSVLRDINLTVGEGEILAILGPSGSGKSTLLNIIAGHIKPTGGNVSFGDGGGLLTHPPRVGMVFQEPALLPWRTVVENVRLPLEFRVGGTGDDDAPGRVARALSFSQLSQFEHCLPAQLSGGMQSRTAIARALVVNPELMLLDEPFGSLDEVTAEDVMLHLSKVLTTISATAVLVTHSLDQAVFLADRIALFAPRPGRISTIVEVAHPRPRTADFLQSDEFVRKVLEVRRTMRGSAA